MLSLADGHWGCFYFFGYYEQGHYKILCKSLIAFLLGEDLREELLGGRGDGNARRNVLGNHLAVF